MSLNELIKNQPKPWLPIRIWNCFIDNVFTLLPNAAAGLVLVSDASGNGTWQNVPNTQIARTIVLTGSGTGSPYSLTDATSTLIDVDGTNLKSTAITVPVGWKLQVAARYYGWRTNTTGGAGAIAIVDTSAATVLDITRVTASGSFWQGTLQAVITGDGNPHTISLQWESSNAGTPNLLSNDSVSSASLAGTANIPSATPRITLTLLHSS